MIRAGYNDKMLVVDILSNSFNDNMSVNYIIKQDRKRLQRIKRLMEYSFEVCMMFGDVFLSEDRKACALILMPDKKKTNFKSILLDIKLITSCIGLSNIKKALQRESKINRLHPKELMYYLWFIGVDPNEQNKGIGSKLLGDIINEAMKNNGSIYLETSTLKNIPWYEKLGFEIYNELDLGYKSYFLKKAI